MRRTNPIKTGEPPAAPRPNPNPPTAAEAAKIIEYAFSDLGWGALVWLAMTSGARRGELCALRWSAVDLDVGTMIINSSVAQVDNRTWIKTNKTHQHRRIALDTATVEILQELRQEAEARAASVGAKLTPDAFVFSPVPDSSTYWLPDTVSQRYARNAERLSIRTYLHELRHYSATELISVRRRRPHRRRPTRTRRRRNDNASRLHRLRLRSRPARIKGTQTPAAKPTPSTDGSGTSLAGPSGTVSADRERHPSRDREQQASGR